MKKPALHWQILLALILAVGAGLIFPTHYQINDTKLSAFQKILPEAGNLQVDLDFSTKTRFINYLQSLTKRELSGTEKKQVIDLAYRNRFVNSFSWMGDLFLRLLKMLIIPLILSSLITGITGIKSGKSLGKLGLKTFAYYVSTSLFAILTGLLLVNIFRPGLGADLGFMSEVEGLMAKQQSFSELLLAIVPTNIFRAMVNGEMLSIIFVALLFGYFITRIKSDASKFLSRFFSSLFDLMMKITLFVIKLTPFGVFGIVLKVIADQDDLGELFSRMGLYMGTVIAALAIHFFITLPILLRIVGKSKPGKHLSNMSVPLLTAFSTSSSGATLPLTIDAVESKSGVSNKVSSFTLPLGATINMDGTALYECVAAIFIAQAYGVDLSFVDQIIVVITALLASIGAAAIPMAGLVMITVILSAVHLPLEGIGLILAVDRILDMFRTATNVWSDSCGAVIIAHSEGEQLNV